MLSDFPKMSIFDNDKKSNLPGFPDPVDTLNQSMVNLEP